MDSFWNFIDDPNANVNVWSFVFALFGFVIGRWYEEKYNKYDRN